MRCFALQTQHIIDANTFRQSMHLSDSGPNELAITFDRRDTGLIAIYLNGTIIANGSLPLISSSKIGDEIWINAREWLNMDTGFRGSLYRFSMYAGVVPAEELGRPCLSIQPSSYLHIPSLCEDLLTPTSSGPRHLILLPTECQYSRRIALVLLVSRSLPATILHAMAVDQAPCSRLHSQECPLCQKKRCAKWGNLQTASQ